MVTAFLDGQLMVMGECLGEVQDNGKGLRDTQHSMSMVRNTKFHI